MQTALILPAAGRSSRMRGADKLLEEVAGLPCLRAMALRGLNAGLAVVVTLPAENHPRAAALVEVPVRRVLVPDADLGMSASLKAGIGAVPPGTEAVIVLPPDMPGITAEDLTHVRDAASAHPDMWIVQATTADGTPGHPILFRKALFSRFGSLGGDTGARDILNDHLSRRLLVQLEDDRARLDLDTPEDWAAWRAGQAAQG